MRQLLHVIVTFALIYVGIEICTYIIEAYSPTVASCIGLSLALIASFVAPLLFTHCWLRVSSRRRVLVHPGRRNGHLRR